MADPGCYAARFHPFNRRVDDGRGIGGRGHSGVLHELMLAIAELLPKRDGRSAYLPSRATIPLRACRQAHGLSNDGDKLNPPERNQRSNRALDAIKPFRLGFGVRESGQANVA